MTKYSFDFKLNVVKRYLNNEGGYKILSKETGVSPTVIKVWINLFEKHGESGLKGGGRRVTIAHLNKMF